MKRSLLYAVVSAATLLCAYSPANAGLDSWAEASQDTMSRLAKARNLETFDAGGGKLLCAPGLCKTLRSTGPWGYADDGASGDSSCTPFHDGPTKPAGAAIPANWVVVPGDGCLYATQNDDAYFAETRKYCPDNSEALREQPQPLLDVDRVTTANFPLALFPDKNSTTSLATVPPGELFTILLAENTGTGAKPKWILVKSGLGIVGWVETDNVREVCGDNKSDNPKVIAGFCFHGG
jgi:hypothetical protein